MHMESNQTTPASRYTLYLPYAVGEFEIEVQAGAREVSFGLWARDDTDTDATLQIEAQLLDAEGQPSHKQHLEARLQLDTDSEEDPEFDRVIRGDLEPVDTAPDVAGIQIRLDDLGNPEFTATPEPGREDELYDSAGRDDIRSKEGNDVIEALAGGDDKIDAGGGDDLVQSGTGSDEVAGGDGKDIVVGGADDDDLYGGEFKTYADVLAEAEGAGGGGEKGDWVDGGEGDDLVAGAAQADGLTGGEGDDIIAGGDGDDTLFGDHALVELGRDWRIERAVEETADKTTYKATLQGGDLEETGAGDDYIEGGAGNDVGFGDGGVDQLVGGAGNDVLSGDALDDPSDPEGSVPGGQHGDDFVDGGEGDDELAGNGGSDQLVGGAGDDEINGDDGVTPGTYHGDDSLEGGVGNDKLWGGGGDDALDGGEGDDYLEGDYDSDKLGGTYHGQDELSGGEGHDTLIGGGGDDILIGGEGDDLMAGDDEDGGSLPEDFHGADELYGEGGNDTLQGNGGDDTLDGGDGVDHLDGGTGDDLLYGGAEGDTLLGDAGDDELHGESGQDRIEGGAGNDTLIGGAETDYLLGGAGDDVYVVESGDAPLNADGTAEYIEDEDGNNILRFGEGIAADAVMPSQGVVEEDLVLEFGGDILVIKDGFNGSVQNFEFANGEILGYDELIGRNAEEAITGENFALGGYNNDTLEASGGNTTLSGGRGDDTLVASGGGNSYRYSLGDGVDTIVDTSKQDGYAASNTLIFGSGITADQVSLDLGSLLIRIDGEAAIHIEGFDPANPAGSAVIDNFRFADGTVLSYAELLQKGFDLNGSEWDDEITGTALADRIAGGQGDDLLDGGAGDDIYLYRNGDGNDIITDSQGENVVRLLDAAPADLVVEKNYHDLILRMADGSSITLPGWLDAESKSIVAVELADGSVLDIHALEDSAVFVEPPGETFYGSDDADLIVAGDGPDTVIAGFGNDEVYGRRGDDALYGADQWDRDPGQGGEGGTSNASDDDILHGEKGNDWLDGGFRADRDTLLGGEGDDTYVLREGSGDDRVIETSGIDRVFVETTPERMHVTRNATDLILELATGDRLTVQNYYLAEGARIETVEFGDGTVWEAATFELLANAATVESALFDGEGTGTVGAALKCRRWWDGAKAAKMACRGASVRIIKVGAGGTACNGMWRVAA
jgi:Ca2+-binding RTX toxin-like protein